VNKNNILYIGAGAAFIFWMARRGQQFAKTLKIGFKKIPSFNLKRTQQTFFTKIYFNVILLVNNSTDTAGTIKSANIKVSINGKKFGNIEQSTPIAIAPNAVTEIPFLFPISTLNLFSNIIALKQAIVNRTGINLTLEGIAITNVGDIEFKETLNAFG